jgi:hypothetical protein
MKLPLADLRPPLPTPMAAAPLAPGADALQWKLQLHRAAAGLAQLQSAPQPRRGNEGNDLESCGAPVLTGASPPPRFDPVPVCAPSAEEPLVPNRGAEREAERAPVRLHVQALTAQGIQVWLGIDGHAALVAQRASVAVADLRRHLQPGTGERIASIVCNGVAVHPRPLSSAAPPARPQPTFLKDYP